MGSECVLEALAPVIDIPCHDDKSNGKSCIGVRSGRVEAVPVTDSVHTSLPDPLCLTYAFGDLPHRALSRRANY